MSLPSIWQRYDPQLLALPGCSACMGLGVLKLRYRSKWGNEAIRGERACDCVYRAVFRLVLATLKDIAQDPPRWPSRYVRLEYAADLGNLIARTLDERERAVFELHCLGGRDWSECPGFSRGDFYHTLYRLQRKLGKAAAELEPYALFPWHEYRRPTSRTPLTKAHAC